MRAQCTVLTLLAGLLVVGCEPSRPPDETLPKVTLVQRTTSGGTIRLTFRLTDLDRVNWQNQVLRVQLVKGDAKPVPGGPVFDHPEPEFTFQVGVGKLTDSENVIFVPQCGRSKDGVMSAVQPLDLVTPDGTTNRTTVPGTSGQKLTQILETCTGPGRTIAFVPREGVKLVTVGYGDDAVSVKVWVDVAAE